MKRVNNIYAKIHSIDNLQLADAMARKGKAKQYGVIAHSKNQDANISALHDMLRNKAYKTSAYTTFTVFEPKERLVYRLPYWPDRITHHAVMNYLEPLFVSVFTNDSYSCIKGKGIHAAANAVKLAVKNVSDTKYCLKLDIKKFYPSIDHEILKGLLRRKIKDADLLWLLDEIIDSADGLPIGNYLSQYFANYYLTGFDHWLKEVVGIKHYFRYADDIVILSNDKAYLHQVLALITEYLETKLKLTVKRNYRVFPVSCGIDFVGYVFYPTHTRLRKSIKQAFCRMMRKRPNRESIASYNGWLKHGNCQNLNQKITNEHLQRIEHRNKDAIRR